MTKAQSVARLQQEFTKSFGAEAAAIGGMTKKLNVIPTGSLTLDYELGTGGWPIGYMSGVFGPRDIGKSSIVALNAVRNAQAMNLVPALILMEPNFDKHWATKHGVDVDELFLSYPESGEEAFAMLHKLLRSPHADLVILDSIGALVSESEIADDGKMKVGGQSGLVTWGVKVAAPLAFRNQKCVILLNQVRDNMQSRYPGAVQQPGGNALEHHESIIVQLKNGKDRYTIKDGGSDVEIGRSIVAHILRNKMSEGSGKKALFDFYSAETEGYPFGIDTVTDVLNIGKRTGVIVTRGAWLDLPSGKSVNGANAAAEYLEKNPEALGQIRDEVLQKMLEREADARAKAETKTAPSVISVVPKAA